MSGPRIFYDEKRHLIVAEWYPHDAVQLMGLLRDEGLRTKDRGWLQDAEALEGALIEAKELAVQGTAGAQEEQ